MRQIVLDTETTGLSPKQGHRIIEIGCVELVDRRLTGNHFHEYINPGRAIDSGALAVHGITSEFLQDKPVYSQIHDAFLEYINGAELIIHNAPFDVGFMNSEFNIHNKKIGTVERYCNIFDTLSYARELHPGQKNNLDILCKRYGIDNFKRDLHGALLDSEILAQVYLAMTSGQESLFESNATHAEQSGMKETSLVYTSITGIETRIIEATDEEQAAHEAYLDSIDKKSNDGALWKRLAEKPNH